MITMTVLICPRCKSEMSVNTYFKGGTVKCESCGAPIAIRDENIKSIKVDKNVNINTNANISKNINNNINKNINHTITKNINKSTTKRFEYVDYGRIAEAEYEYKKDENKLAIISILIISLLLVLIFVFLWAHQNLPDIINNSHINKAEEQGLICAGEWKEYKGKNHKEVKQRFEDMGFTNVTEHALGDTIAIWDWGKVVYVSVGGRTEFGYSNYFSLDDPVIISFH